MTLKEKVEEVRAAYEVLKPYVKDDEYFAYLNGLLDARALEVDAKEQLQVLPPVKVYRLRGSND